MEVISWYRWMASLLTIIYSEANILLNATTSVPPITQNNILNKERLTNDWTTTPEAYKDISNNFTDTFEELMGSTLSTNESYFTTIPPSIDKQMLSEKMTISSISMSTKVFDSVNVSTTNNIETIPQNFSLKAKQHSTSLINDTYFTTIPPSTSKHLFSKNRDSTSSSEKNITKDITPIMSKVDTNTEAVTNTTEVTQQASILINDTFSAPSTKMQPIRETWTPLLSSESTGTNEISSTKHSNGATETRSDILETVKAPVNNTHFTDNAAPTKEEMTSQTWNLLSTTQVRSSESPGLELGSTVTKSNQIRIMNSKMSSSTVTSQTAHSHRKDTKNIKLENKNGNISNEIKEIRMIHQLTQVRTHPSRNEVISHVAVWITVSFVVVVLVYVIGLVAYNRQRTEWCLEMRRYVRFENDSEPDFEADRDCYNQPGCSANIFTEDDKNVVDSMS